jgi:hypothetical protein
MLLERWSLAVQPACVLAASQAIGRQVTEAEANAIEKRIVSTMRVLAREDPAAWAAKPAAQRLIEASQAAAQQLVAEAQLKQRRNALSILAQARIKGHMQNMSAKGLSSLDALDRVSAFHADGKSDFLSIETHGKAVERDSLRRMLGTIEAAHPKWFGLFENAEGVRQIVQELFGEDSGNAEARAGAKEFHAVAEELRQRFNAAGGDVGRLEDWAIPQHHSQMKTAKAGRDTWVADVMPALKRERYVNPDGSLMNSAELADFLGHAWESIATGGANKIEPGQFRRTGARANRGNEHRQIHFKDAQAYLDYQRKYGERAMYEVLAGHVSALSKDIAHVEILGPNPDATFRFLRDQAVQDATLANPTKAGKIAERAVRSDNLYNVVSGKTQPLASEWLAKSFDTLRSWLIASRLGSAVVTAFSDDATMYLTAKLNNLPQMQLLSNELAAMNPANSMEKRLAQRAGLGLQTVVAALNRFGQEGLGRSWSSKLANATIRASLLDAVTEARRRAFGTTFMGALGSVVKEHPDLASLDATDHRLLLSKGVTENDFAVWKLAKLEDWGGGNDTMLTPESIYRVPDSALSSLGDPAALKRQAATRLLGSVLEETDVAIVEPGARERVQTGSTLPRGTWKGELTRSFFLFKSFPLAMIERHWARGFGVPSVGGKAAYIAGLIASTTVLGMASRQVHELLAGRDPRKMFGEGSWKTWLSAALTGGSLGIYGDFLFSQSTQHGGSLLSTIEGPVFGVAEEFLNLTQGNIVEAMQGKDTNFGAEATKFIKGVTPGASLWYAKAALDHMIYHQLMEYFSPGYLSKMKQRLRREFDQRYWWEPGRTLPDRPPDLKAIAGD